MVNQEVRRVKNITFGHYAGIHDVDASPSDLSLADIYKQECNNLNIKHNELIMSQLPKCPGVGRVRELNVGCTYIGDKGLQALFPVLEASPELARLKLSDNGLKNDSVLRLLKHLRKHGGVISLDLASNKYLSGDVGAQCLALAKSQNQLLQVSLARTGVSKAIQNSLEGVLRENRKRSGENNRRRFEQRVRIDKRKLFEAKEIFDSLDKDRSGTVSVSELSKICGCGDPCTVVNDSGAEWDTFGIIDKNNDGQVTIIEYLMVAIPGTTASDVQFAIDCYSEFEFPDYIPPPELSPDQVREIKDIFNTFDKSGDGQLTLAEVKAGMGKSAMCVDVNEYFSSFDTSNDGLLSLPEFIELMKSYYI